jgi:hypothetical protein
MFMGLRSAPGDMPPTRSPVDDFPQLKEQILDVELVFPAVEQFRPNTLANDADQSIGDRDCEPFTQGASAPPKIGSQRERPRRIDLPLQFFQGLIDDFPQFLP